MSNVLTSSEFIRSVRRRTMAPENTEVYDDQDILDIASEEINTEIMPSLLSVNEGYMMYHVDIPIELGESRYSIPERAYATKLKDAALIDESGNFIEVAHIDVGRISDFNNTFASEYQSGVLYVENDEIVFVSTGAEGFKFIRMYFYMRPSALVEENKAGRITSISDDGTNTVLTLETFPSQFTNISTNLFDIVSNKNPNKIHSYDLTASSVNKNSKTITFASSDLSDNISTNNYLCFAKETIVPQVPVEMHPLLAQTVAIHILEGLGDEQNKQSAERKLERMTKNLTGIFERRIEESGKKIVARHSTISEATRSFSRGRFRGRRI